MPVTVRGGDILFNDGTTQSTAGGAVNTTSVLNATAGATAGAVGTYAILATSFTQSLTNNSTYAGSNLRFIYFMNLGNAYSILSYASGTPSGTWRYLGGSTPGNVPVSGALFLRIS